MLNIKLLKSIDLQYVLRSHSFLSLDEGKLNSTILYAKVNKREEKIVLKKKYSFDLEYFVIYLKILETSLDY